MRKNPTSIQQPTSDISDGYARRIKYTNDLGQPHREDGPALIYVRYRGYFETGPKKDYEDYEKFIKTVCSYSPKSWTDVTKLHYLSHCGWLEFQLVWYKNGLISREGDYPAYIHHYAENYSNTGEKITQQLSTLGNLYSVKSQSHDEYSYETSVLFSQNGVANRKNNPAYIEVLYPKAKRDWSSERNLGFAVEAWMTKGIPYVKKGFEFERYKDKVIRIETTLYDNNGRIHNENGPAREIIGENGKVQYAAWIFHGKVVNRSQLTRNLMRWFGIGNAEENFSVSYTGNPAVASDYENDIIRIRQDEAFSKGLYWPNVNVNDVLDDTNNALILNRETGEWSFGPAAQYFIDVFLDKITRKLSRVENVAEPNSNYYSYIFRDITEYIPEKTPKIQFLRNGKKHEYTLIVNEKAIFGYCLDDNICYVLEKADKIGKIDHKLALSLVAKIILSVILNSLGIEVDISNISKELKKYGLQKNLDLLPE